MFRNNSKRSNNCFRIICLVFCLIFINITPAFAGAQPVVDSPANVKLQAIVDWLNNFLTYHYDYYNGNIYSRLGDIINDILAVGGQVADVSSKLITSNNYLSSIDSKTKNYTSYIDNIETYLNDIQYEGTVSGTFVDGSLNTITTNTRVNNPDSYYFMFNFGTNYSHAGVFKVSIPVGANSRTFAKYSFAFYDINNSNDIVNLSPDYIYSYNQQHNTIDLFITNLNYNYPRTLIKVTSSNGFYYVYPNSTNIFYQYVNSNSKDFIELSDYIHLNRIDNKIDSISNNIQSLKDIYASDDVIQAKQNQQNFETQAITDFTGNGNNSASLNDLGSVSNISSSVKNGLNAGGSISGGLSVFDANNSDFWGWFSQSNYNEINGVQNRRMLTNNEYYDYVTDNQDELERLLNKYD